MRTEIEGLVTLYEQSRISRRGLIEAMAAIAAAGAAAPTLAQPVTSPVVRARTINHVTVTTNDVARSKAFYTRLAGMAIKDEGPGFCELQLGNGFFGIYEPWRKAQPLGIDHICLGIDGYEPNALLDRIKTAMPEAQAELEFGQQVYVRDPDGATIQFADINYKR